MSASKYKDLVHNFNGFSMNLLIFLNNFLIKDNYFYLT